MFHIENMTADMESEVIGMVLEFYESNAVDHKVPENILLRTFKDAVSPDPVLKGHVLMDEKNIAGFAYITEFYACETGGRCIMLEELFLKPEARGKGYGSKYIQWLIQERPDVKRFRLEVTESNVGAIKLYERLGFKYLNYKQMTFER